MAVCQQNWRPVALISACSLLAALGFVLAQEPPLETPKPSAPIESAVESPRLSSRPQDFAFPHQLPSPLSGTALDDGKNLAQDRAAIFARVAAEEAAAAQESALPLPIQIADEVVMITEQLRLLARNLDRVAADDEDEANYERADQLRKTAARLRREARNLRPE